MKKLLIAAALSALTTGSVWAETIRMGTEGAYPPYNFINDAGEVDGFERQLGDEICKRAELDCVWVTNDWDSIIPNLISGNYDTIIAGMSVTPEREQVVDFSSEYYPASPSSYVAAAGMDVDLSSGIIAAQTNTIQAGHVAASGATLVEFATPDETVAAVKNGEADAVLADKDYLAPIVAESGGALEFVGEDVAIGGGIGIGLRKSDTELKAKLDAVIDEMKADGTLNEMLSKWFEGEAPQW
nr:transporter substrate-binding domain-containing protein [Amylibacter sp.]